MTGKDVNLQGELHPRGESGKQKIVWNVVRITTGRIWKPKLSIIFLAIVLILVGENILISQSNNIESPAIIKSTTSIEFSASSEGVLNPWSFTITNDSLYIVPDFRGGNVKVFEEKNGVLELVQIIGRYGYGPGELAKPTYCYYSKEESKLLIMDSGQNRIFLYSRDKTNKYKFERDKIDIPCYRGAYGMYLKNKTVFIAGHITDENGTHYDLYSYNLDNGNLEYYLTSIDKYQFSADKTVEEQFAEKQISKIGTEGFFDINGNYAFYTWTGILRILKIDLRTHNLVDQFGKKIIGRYKAPTPTKKLNEVYKQGDPLLIQKERAKRSYVKSVFTGSEGIYLIYSTPAASDKEEGEMQFRLQFYSFSDNGKLSKESLLDIQSENSKYFFEKDSNTLYILSLSKKGRYFISGMVID